MKKKYKIFWLGFFSVLCVTIFAFRLPTEEKSPAVRDILTKSIAMSGGEENWRKINHLSVYVQNHSIRPNGNIMKLGKRTSHYRFPGSYYYCNYTELPIPGVFTKIIEQHTPGDSIYRLITNTESKILQDLPVPKSLLFADESMNMLYDKGYSFSEVSIGDFNEKSCFSFLATYKNRTKTTWYYNRDTFSPEGYHERDTNSEVVNSYSEFIWVENVRLPGRVNSVIQYQGASHSGYKTFSYEINKPVADYFFVIKR